LHLPWDLLPGALCRAEALCFRSLALEPSPAVEATASTPIFVVASYDFVPDDHRHEQLLDGSL
jgi:hypothetical protein